MTRSAPTIVRRGLPAASAAVLLAVAACSDGPSAPGAEPPDIRRATEPPDVRASSDLVVVGTPRIQEVTVKLHVRDQGYGDVAPSTFEFKTDAGVAKTVVDNGPGDADARPAYFSVQMPKANAFTATAKALPDEDSFFQASKTVSYYNSPTLVDMQTLTLYIKPGLFITMYYQGAIITGQTLKISNGGDFSATITDGGPSDKDQWGNQSPADGKIFVRVPNPGNYNVCAMTSPSWGWGGCTVAWPAQFFMAYGVDFNYKQEWVIPKFP